MFDENKVLLVPRILNKVLHELMYEIEIGLIMMTFFSQCMSLCVWFQEQGLYRLHTLRRDSFAFLSLHNSEFEQFSCFNLLRKKRHLGAFRSTRFYLLQNAARCCDRDECVIEMHVCLWKCPSNLSSSPGHHWWWVSCFLPFTVL